MDKCSNNTFESGTFEVFYTLQPIMLLKSQKLQLIKSSNAGNDLLLSTDSTQQEIYSKKS